jgi:hypothetical protein
LAVFLAPIHVEFKALRLWEAEGEVALTDGGLKVGCRSLTTIREIPLPGVTTEQRAKFAILCSLEVHRDLVYRRWADNWLSGQDRSARAAMAARAASEAARAARVAARAAAWEAASEAASEAAWEAAWEASEIDLITIARKAVL